MLQRSYRELMQLPTFEERFNYLKLDGVVGESTFGFNRYLNQALYIRSPEWKAFRARIIARDEGYDLACNYDSWYEIAKYATVHHINPLTQEDLLYRSDLIFDPNNAITVSSATHRAIHFSTIEAVPKKLVERAINDTCPWKCYL